jgi:hypothetical protein
VKKLKVKLPFVLLGFLLLLCSFPLVEAGFFSIPPATIYGTTITVSASYPDFRFDEPTNVSLTITVNFYNESVSAVNITAIHVRLYYSSVDVSQKASSSPSLQDSYAYANWLSTDYYGSFPYPPSTPFPYKIERQSSQVTTGFWNVPLTLSYMLTMQQEVQAKLYIQVTLCFLDINGEAICYWTIFSGEGEAPYVTIYPKITEQFWLFRPEIFAILVGSIGLVLVGVTVIYMKRKGRKIQGTQG